MIATRIARLVVTCACVCAAVGCARRASVRFASSITVAAGSSCVDDGEIRARVGEALAARSVGPDDIVIRIESNLVGTVHEVRLHVSRRDSPGVGVDRTYELRPEDCASSARLVALAVDRFVASFPELAGPPAAVVERPAPRSIDLVLDAALTSLWQPFGVEGRAGVRVDLVLGETRLGAGALLRASWPQQLAPGRYQHSSALGAVRYARDLASWRLGIEARAGVVAVTGLGFSENRSDALPWWEGALVVGRQLGRVNVGVEVAGTALQHAVVVEGAPGQGELSQWRVGLTLEVGISSWGTNP